MFELSELILINSVTKYKFIAQAFLSVQFDVSRFCMQDGQQLTQ